MRILHLCLANFYIDNYSYQENMLPKFHKKAGHDVSIVASLVSFDENGKATFLEKGSTYENEYGIPVTRLDYKNDSKMARKLRCYKNTYEALEKYNPEIIFIHCVQFMDIKEVVRYIKDHPDVIVYADSHTDFSNSATNWVSKNILHKIIWKHCAKKIAPYVKRFYGVLPARVEFLHDVYGLPKEKIELLVMGADDEKVEEAQDEDGVKALREKYGIKDDDFLIVTGGKIDRNKPETLNLMKAVALLDRKVKLLVFGSVIPELKEAFEKLLENKNIIYAGWIKAEEAYSYFAAANLVFFPGKHSVFWEQVVGMGIPAVFRKIEGFSHVDVGGNCIFVENATETAIAECIADIVDNSQFYETLKKNAREKGIQQFSYKRIAERSIL